jgi:hypothetical protein
VACPHRLPILPESTQRKQAIPNCKMHSDTRTVSPTVLVSLCILQYGTHHSYVLVAHTLRVAENEILKLDLPAKRHE